MLDPFSIISCRLICVMAHVRISFPRLRILLYVYFILCLCINSLMDAWVTSKSWLWWSMTIGTSKHMFSFIDGIKSCNISKSTLCHFMYVIFHILLLIFYMEQGTKSHQRKLKKWSLYLEDKLNEKSVLIIIFII